LAKKKAAAKGATYPMRALAELSRGSARVWEAWAAKPGRPDQLAYGARTLSLLFRTAAFVMDVMADADREEDAPPAPALYSPPK
jgi:hypothetical protein